jgi:hypothetical protein
MSHDIVVNSAFTVMLILKAEGKLMNTKCNGIILNDESN